MEYLGPIALLLATAIVVIISPGPDFFLVVKNSLHSRAAGIYTALGSVAGLFFHSTYSLVGLGLLIAHSPLAFTVVSYVGAIYLVYLGLRTMLSSRKLHDMHVPYSCEEEKPAYYYMRQGFLCNALNPKVTLFFVGIFSQVITPDMPIVFQIMVVLCIVLLAALWFIGVAYALSSQHIKSRFAKAEGYVVRPLGGALVLLGIKLALF